MMLGWGVVAIFLVIDLVWFPFTRMVFVASVTFWSWLICAALLGMIYFVFGALMRRLDGDHSKVAVVIRVVSDRCRLMIATVIFNIALFGGFLTFTYLTASMAWPLLDAQLAAIDRSLGFDWLATLALTHAHPVLGQILTSAYKSSGFQLVFACLMLGVLGRREQLCELLSLLAITALLTGILNGLVPAAGAYAHYSPPPEMFAHLSHDAGMWHYKLLLSLRNDAAPVVDFTAAEGLVTFPSFHTILAILTAYGLRGIRYLFWPAVFINAVVIFSTLPEGGHHLVDIIVGAAIAALAIFVLNPAARGSGMKRLSACFLRGVRFFVPRPTQHF